MIEEKKSKVDFLRSRWEQLNNRDSSASQVNQEVYRDLNRGIQKVEIRDLQTYVSY